MKSALVRVNSEPVNLFDFDRKGLEALFAELGEKPFRASQVIQWIYQHGITDFDVMTNLSKALREQLREISHITPPEIIFRQHSTDGTRKWLLQLDCGNRIETVYIPEDGRGTLCVSSQVGCALGCTFCSTAQQGFNRNLSVAEIIGQVWAAKKELGEDKPLTNVVLMGMGEPLLNFNNVIAATNLMMDDFAYSFSKRRVTLSTSGITPAIEQLKGITDMSLALSLHAPDDELRNELVPVNRKYPVKEVLQACKRYMSDLKGRKITVEYVMLEGVNDSPAQAKALCRLLGNVPAKINLIPFNPFPNSDYRCSGTESIDRFWGILNKAGFITTLRRSRGQDIDAACGQLVGKVQNRSRRQNSRAIGS